MPFSFGLNPGWQLSDLFHGAALIQQPGGAANLLQLRQIQQQRKMDADEAKRRAYLDQILSGAATGTPSIAPPPMLAKPGMETAPNPQYVPGTPPPMLQAQPTGQPQQQQAPYLDLNARRSGITPKFADALRMLPTDQAVALYAQQALKPAQTATVKPGDTFGTVNDGQFTPTYTAPSAPDKQTETEKEIQRLQTENGLSETDARDVVFKRKSIIQNPVTGENLLFNARDNSISKISSQPNKPNAPSQPVVQPPSPQQPPRTLWEDATSTGAFPALKSGVSAISGQIGLPVASQTIEARQRLISGSQPFIRAMALNPRYPVGEVDRLREEVKIDPSVFDSPGALRARMVGIDQSLQTRQQNEERAGSDSSLPVETRQAALQAANAIKDFRKLLGVPPGAASESNSNTGDISSMTKEQLDQLDPKNLTTEQLRAAEKRMNELGQ